MLLKPQTYMNLSGTAVREAVNWYNRSPLADVLVVVDDIDVRRSGSVRLRARGGSGGHNGLKSIIAELGIDAFPRMRIGIGRGPGHATRQVLSRFTSDEERLLPAVLEAAADCVLEWERHGIIDAMNRCNRGPEPRMVRRRRLRSARFATPSPAIRARTIETIADRRMFGSNRPWIRTNRRQSAILRQS